MAAELPWSTHYPAFGEQPAVIPIYNALDPENAPSCPDGNRRWACDLLFVGHRLPDREPTAWEEFFSFAQRNLLRTANSPWAEKGWGNKAAAGQRAAGSATLVTGDHNRMKLLRPAWR